MYLLQVINIHVLLIHVLLIHVLKNVGRGFNWNSYYWYSKISSQSITNYNYMNCVVNGKKIA